MSRGLITAQVDAVEAETVRHALAIALEFDSGTSRVTTAPYSIDLDGDTFVGGLLAQISSAEETSELGATSMTAVLSGIPRDAIATALAESYQNRPATVWLVLFDDDWAPIDPVVIFRGRIDQMIIELGATARVTVTLSSRLLDWERPRLKRYSDEEQQRDHTGDVGLQYASAVETFDITWPNKEWFRNHPG